MHVNDKFFLEGGTEVYIRQVSDLLLKQGHQISVVYGEGPDVREVEKQGYTAYKVAGLGERDEHNAAFTLEQVTEVIKKENPEVVNLHNLQNALVVEQFIKLAPTMRYVHDHRLYCPGFSKTWYNSNQMCPIPFSLACLMNAYKEHCATRRPVKLLQKFQEKFYELEVNQRLSRVLLASRYMKSQMLINKFAEEKMVVVPDFVTLPAKITPVPKNRQLLFVGRLTIEKGLQYVLQALVQIPEAELVVVGTGPQQGDYVRQAQESNISERVKFVDDISKEKVGDYYEAAAVVAFTSIWPEPHGKIGPEAMSHGRPVVAFDSGGVGEWLQDGVNGYLVKRLDVDALTKKINLLLSDNKLANKLGVGGRDFVEKTMNEDRYLKALIQIYQETMATWQPDTVAAMI